MENGILLAGTSLTKGMPMIVEIGVFFDVFVGVLMAGVLVFQIKTTVESIDTSRLSDLKE
jgi:Hydrogenase 4 membrane component (E)